MGNSTAVSTLVIAAAAALAPFLADLLRKLRIPPVLFELLLGILIGPAVLGWVSVDKFVAGVAAFGLAMLFFMAGYEIDFSALKGRPLNRALGGWAISVALGLGVGVVLMLSGFVVSSLLVGLALTTTAIGTLLPMMRDRKLLGTPFGDLLSAAGAVGEFGPVVAVTLLLSAGRPGRQAAVLLGFVIITVVVGWIAVNHQPARASALLEKHLHTSSQLPVRVLILLVAALVVLATRLGLDNLLGAFAAGMIARLAIKPEHSKVISSKLDAVAFGFFIPVFFVVSGVKFGLDELKEPSTLVRVPIFLALLLVVRGLPAMLVYRKILSTRARAAMTFLQAAALPLLVVITEIGLATDRMRPSNAAALVGAGMLSILVFPLTGFALLDGSEEMLEDEPALQPDPGAPADWDGTEPVRPDPRPEE
jgi:Kef-type K+ transport system membrane component KefB